MASLARHKPTVAIQTVRADWRCRRVAGKRRARFLRAVRHEISLPGTNQPLAWLANIRRPSGPRPRSNGMQSQEKPGLRAVSWRRTCTGTPIQPLRGWDCVSHTVPWVAPTAIDVEPLRGCDGLRCDCFGHGRGPEG